MGAFHFRLGGSTLVVSTLTLDPTIKLSISLPAEEIAFMDGYAHSQGIKSRSGVVRAALRNLRTSELADSYASAWADSDDEEDRDWDRSLSDGLMS